MINAEYGLNAIVEMKKNTRVISQSCVKCDLNSAISKSNAKAAARSSCFRGMSLKKLKRVVERGEEWEDKEICL